ncbi:MAG: alpha/beta hydrolase [Pseudomonadota bacterium]
MPMNPGFAPLLEMMAPLAELDWAKTPAEQLRALMDNPLPPGEDVPMARVEDMSIPVEGGEIAARFYLPENADRTPPAITYLHGGGWVLGTLETHDATCRLLARASEAAILSVAYRLAPEHRYPTAAEDCYAALTWLAENAAELGVDGTRLAVAGDSAGGNLAAAATLMTQERNGPDIAHQLLIYPVTDTDFERPSYREHGAPGGFLSTDAMRRFWSDYLGDTAPDDAPLAALIRDTDLSGLPPATVIVAECDPLHDEGVAYAKRLEKAGVPVELIDADGMIHGFVSMSAIVPEIGETIARAGARLKAGLA